MRIIVSTIATLVFATSAFAQIGVGAYVPPGPGPYLGFWAGPAFGYVPGAYRGFWSNGYSLYGPPVPTYGSVPGYFGGSDQRLSNFPDLRNSYYGPWGWRGAYIPLDRPANPPVLLVTPAAICEVHLPAADAELFLNGAKVDSAGMVRRFSVTLPHNAGTTYQLEARWDNSQSIGSARRTATLRAGETTTVDFTSSGS